MKDGKNTKKKLHQRNKHQELYNFDQLKSVVPELEAFIIKNPSGVDTIDFAIPEAVVLLNKAILMKDYKMTFWEMPKTNLCPPIPGRADYIHYIADLLAEGNNGKVPTGRGVKILDLGIGANVIYPIIGVAEYGWEFVGSEVDVVSVKTASHIIENNPHLKSNVTIRKQLSKRNILKNIIEDKEYFDVVICNPPFFKSRAEVLATTTKKLKNLGKEVVGKPVQNFSGQNNELWCEGGEKAFITNYIYESKHFKRQAVWFTTLVSNKDNLKPLQSLLKRSETKEVRIINMEQGNKVSRILAWRY
ncbi:23S rRNA (adenine(1618)-N(6))-methyltransferase RlmF [Myroides marinus]|uniref:23S rRNA (adenine(1618)-N(6))-methyltransferase RlmF n=1 Tax=Myroides TaxID=76831 RepID=UPI0007421F57|nr:23S rRNA (adenine(1618)-N(6))-methyltransferase RlmF [Myroides marinus]KUF41333.1 23S rRNA methyltransferase [Myroides marinus]MDM1347891.1 23S rRNA (adenine(1618)-N(6))-methyltransferase RlmF [Myroides marinus]MDM1355870.1 23S rRNA (adenine(1618)-N(6))-methyltransferase RlmF [Myroides marinus]MDM1362415.1 23S rRNA (adenine(1618)-N(6))-methyltransferase RlmF [Myroides marinus]MDM1365812.1 23S rRNA (adenine(1618)-N(6))-methyltransferase RlmF [Myroides marinus]